MSVRGFITGCSHPEIGPPRLDIQLFAEPTHIPIGAHVRVALDPTSGQAVYAGTFQAKVDPAAIDRACAAAIEHVKNDPDFIGDKTQTFADMPEDEAKKTMREMARVMIEAAMHG